MTRLLMIVPILAMTFALSAPVAQAQTEGVLPGDSCGSTTPAPPAAGVTDVGEAHWYDVSYSDAGSRVLKLRHGIMPFDPIFDILAIITYQMTLYEWDPVTNECTEIATSNADNLTCLIFGEPGVCGTITQPGPGNYQLEIVRPSWSQNPNWYTLSTV